MAFLASPPVGQFTRRIRRLARIVLAGFAWLISPELEVRAQAARAIEYQINAVCLLNFAQFVTWPPGTFADVQAPIVIGVLGADPFGRYLDEAIAGETANGRPLVAQRYRRVEEIKTCHVLFISQSEAGRLDQILDHLKGRSILSVGDGEGFDRRGGMIRFLTESNKVRFRVNLAAAQAVDLTISSKLLRSAEVIGREKK